MISKVYQRGQIVIPSILRHKYGMEIGQLVEIVPEKDYIKIKKAKTKSILDLSGVIETDKLFPTKEDINALVKKGFCKEEKDETR